MNRGRYAVGVIGVLVLLGGAGYGAYSRNEARLWREECESFMHDVAAKDSADRNDRNEWDASRRDDFMIACMNGRL